MKKIKLNDLCINITDGSHFSPQAVDIGYPMYSVKDMNDFGFNETDYKMISKEDFESLVKAGCKPLKDDVLIAKDGSYLKYSFVCEEEKDEVILSSIAILRPKKNIINPKFFSYLLKNPTVKKSMKYYVSGTALPRIVLDNFKKMEVYIPETVDEQKRIAKVLTDIDSKITLNKKINKELETMAKELYDYWFVQFDFPNAQGKPYKSSGGKMIYNPILKREIPDGWEVKKISDFTEIFTGHKDVSKVIPGLYKFFSCAPDSITSNEYIYDGEAILVSGNGSYTGRVSYYKGKMDLYQRTYGCKPKEMYRNIMPFLYYSMKYLFQPVMTGGKHGSSIPYIVLGDLADFYLVYNENVVTKFIHLIGSCFYKQMESIPKENDELTKLRDELLPLLMNGQVSVKG